MNDDVGMYCDVCASSVQVRHYHAIDMDLCDECKPMLIDLIERAEDGNRDNNTWGTSSPRATTV